MVRLASTHRATDDLDSLGPYGTLDLLRATPVTRDTVMATSLSVDGVKIDVIEIEPGQWDEAAQINTLAQQMFVVGQMWSYESATSMTLDLAGQMVSVPVARPAGLLGGKLGAALSTSDSSPKPPGP